ncbi:endo alpha-1,4 polygalactosaminidase [Streptomyces caatingaensis]|uniref:Endo alpha-1,4 polygalactosaminidase n=1 Tax=Streptomyces caatingaensis TaxID=1678637 RepID=A0A0K9XGG9_9ACTN|nr:endo alpha-1,4 polygalactosaminidase [Streptomyces caatingaensis]KNB52338.1 endo alpha-1,4 polygalactosaminidase [Streptomyces caatingaensis]
MADRTMRRRRLRGGALTAAALLVATGCAGNVSSSGEAGPPPAGASHPASHGPSPSPKSPKSTPRKGRWQPTPGTRWQWQLDGAVDTSVDVPVYDIDGFENDAATVAKLHADGRKVICYVNVGAYEDWRPDHDRFPASVLGAKNEGWKGEQWLDIRRLDVLRPIMAERFDMCREKGFDAVEPDLTEGFRNRTGFPLTAAHQLAFNRMIASLAHERGLAVGLKNDLEQIPELVGDFDFAVNEQCAQYGECERLRPFVARGKAVFHVEYEMTPGEFCGGTRRLGLSSMRKKLGLNAWRQAC